jgi:hypothetical protein
VSIDYARRDVLVIQINEPAAAGQTSGQGSPNQAVAAAAAEYLRTGKLDAAVIQKLMASGQIPAALAMKIAAAKNNPEKLQEIAKSLAAPQDGPAPGLSFVKPEVAEGEPLRLELLSFFDSVRTRKPPRVTAQQGRAALALALEIQSAMVAHAQRAGLTDFFTAGN